MRERGIRDDVAPWSFFLPVTLAVIVGVVAAGLIGRGIDAVFTDGDDGGSAARTPAATHPAAASDLVDAAAPLAPAPIGATTGGAAPGAEAPLDAASTLPAEAPPDPLDAPGEGVASGAESTEPAANAAPVAEPAVPALPGAIVARRDGAPEACISGTIATRDANGWQQRLENDAPVACTELSTAPRP
ncbi:hypothetical protein [Luteimonas kalidii]|uniref:Uncharacterized protein n=1 Tax=Luteimonas kalidii TaxID=3042025 RepID=A0ABT6JTU9_9GAMM|nr:hypothetical protein [Luteimonas kalidii]MDH5834109.1 hypothetical protein [Luteimonas kalidii]